MGRLTKFSGIIFRRLFLSSTGEKKLTPIGAADTWTLLSECLGPESVVVSGGVGTVITFELELAAQTGAQIHLFDPSPTGAKTITSIGALAENITFSNVGLAGSDSSIGFSKPDRESEGSFKPGSDIVFQCRSVSSLFQENGWKKIDLLKIDIEGFEYEVLDDILKNRLPVEQICVEFHWKGQIDIDHTLLDIVKMLFKLRSRGYRCVSLRKSDFTFCHKSVLGW